LATLLQLAQKPTSSPVVATSTTVPGTVVVPSQNSSLNVNNKLFIYDKKVNKCLI
jgi:hypothetical protein